MTASLVTAIRPWVTPTRQPCVATDTRTAIATQAAMDCPADETILSIHLHDALGSPPGPRNAAQNAHFLDAGWDEMPDAVVWLKIPEWPAKSTDTQGGLGLNLVVRAMPNCYPKTQ